MSKYNYTEFEQQMNNVLKYQDEQLKNIHFPNANDISDSIRESEELLREMGISSPDREVRSDLPPKSIMVVPSWENLCVKAETVVDGEVSLEDLFTIEELRQNELAIRELNEEYNQLHRLDKYDMAIAAVAGLLAAAIDILMVGIPKPTPEGVKGGTLANYVRDYFNQRYPAEEMEKSANSKVSKVPYDAQDNRNTVEYVEGLSAYYHRLLALGHDPFLGFLFGVMDIMTGRMTTIDKSGKIISQIIPEYADRTEKDIFAAIAKQITHLKSDITTSMGLPAPMMSLFNLLDFGDIGDEHQTIAEIVQGMYYQGYDFIHFCSQSIPVMIAEVVTRLGYAIKRIKEGHAVKDSIPVSINHEKHPKLGTMLFIGHTSATAINAGKVYFTKNPMAINYPQWLAFSKYSYQQMKWVLIDKPKARDAYVKGKIDDELYTVLDSVEDSFELFAKNYVVVME